MVWPDPRLSTTHSAMAFRSAEESFSSGTTLDTTSTWQPCCSRARTVRPERGSGL